jgi:hypothetical protein
MGTVPSGPFSEMLKTGEPHLKALFFDLAVLETYSNDPRYYFNFRGYSGWIGIHDNFYYSPDTEERDKIYLKMFGLAYDEQGRRVLTVFLTDLANLSPEHQQLWMSNLISKPCKLVSEYYQNMILGVWTKSISIYDALVHEQSEINKLCGLMGRPALFFKTFENKQPKEFRLYFRPTRKNFVNFVQTLDKMLSDNIDKKFFLDDVPLLTEEAQPLGTLKLLENWLQQNISFTGSECLARFMKPLVEIRRLRSEGAHKLIEDEYDPKYHTRQDKLVEDVWISLCSLRKLFAQHPDVQGYVAPAFLDSAEIKIF